MKTRARYLAYKVEISKDAETSHIVAEVPALGIADDGLDYDEALANIRNMVTFHLECLLEEGQPIPVERGRREGFYLRVKLPARAA